ncbi:uncharacterized protein LOC131930909 [Physella acuta]|uniref:uncharacterized protein LOC131930909 n=1 Tax=Physella acuta TaxID=109671 RepID=UPI0027DD55C6|nr:uncharacterized protein LOC131930909 [Physella acuta]
MGSLIKSIKHILLFNQVNNSTCVKSSRKDIFKQKPGSQQTSGCSSLIFGKFYKTCVKSSRKDNFKMKPGFQPSSGCSNFKNCVHKQNVSNHPDDYEITFLTLLNPRGSLIKSKKHV